MAYPAYPVLAQSITLTPPPGNDPSKRPNLRDQLTQIRNGMASSLGAAEAIQGVLDPRPVTALTEEQKGPLGVEQLSADLQRMVAELNDRLKDVYDRLGG